MHIYIIRHGETDANKQHLYQGSTDCPLNEYGRILACITGKALKDIEFDVTYVSPLSRAKETAALILKNSGNENCQVYEDKRITEIDFGKWEMTSYRVFPNIWKRIKARTFFHVPDLIFSFPAGENAHIVKKRTQAFFKELIKKDYDNVLVVTHGFAMLAMLNPLFKKRWDFWQGHHTKNCCVSIVEVYDGKAKLLVQNKVYY